MRSPLLEKTVNDASNQALSPSKAPGGQPDSVQGGFDQETFKSFTGASISPEALDIIRRSSGNNLERAVNMYFDGTWKKPQKPLAQTPAQPIVRKPAGPVDRTLPDAPQPEPATRPLHRSMPHSRYIGACGAQGWITRSGGTLKTGEIVKVERQKIQPPQPSQSRVKFGTPPPRINTAAMRRVDTIVRFTDSKGSEIGRLVKETADWVSSLIDQDVCKFEAVCVYAPEGKLRTNDTIYLQLRCYILKACFQHGPLQLADNRNTGIYEVRETTEERDLRLRQVGLVRLFQEIDLMPTRAAAKHNRQGLLNAAEADGKNEKSASSKSSGNPDPGSSPPSDEAEDGQELEQDQLDALYRKAQSFDFDTPEAEPADTFAMDLRPYQKQSLHWMLSKEKDLKNEAREASMHPLWEEYAWPTKDVDDKDVLQVDGQSSFYVNPYSGEMSLEFPLQEQHCLGGILADEMGLGKTIQMLSLIHTHKSETVQAPPALHSANSLPGMSRNSANVLPAPKTTLVIAPMSLLAQWQSEAENASKEGTLKSMVYYGSEKTGNLQALCCEANYASAPDIIITSYGSVLSEFTQIAAKNKYDHTTQNGLFSLKFFRIILDEAHTIKNRQSKTAKACYDLAAEHRWVLTGTPIVNRLEDLFSLVRFLRVEPWNNFSFWRTFITVPFESKDFMRALDVVQTVLEPLVMRRTKDMKTPDGRP
jgi:DNA repair protein RAD5